MRRRRRPLKVLQVRCASRAIRKAPVETGPTVFFFSFSPILTRPANLVPADSHHIVILLLFIVVVVGYIRRNIVCIRVRGPGHALRVYSRRRVVIGFRARSRTHNAPAGIIYNIIVHVVHARDAAAAETTCLNAGLPARAHHAAVPGDGHGLRVRVVPATSGRQRRTPSSRSRRARRRRSSRGRSGRGRVQPFVVRARRLVHAVRQTKPAARRTRVSCVFHFISLCSSSTRIIIF